MIPHVGALIDESLSTYPKSVMFIPAVTGKFEFYCKN